MTTRPCPNPKVLAEPADDRGLVMHICQVPRCGWTFTSVKSAQDVSWHKRAHRDAVPSTRIERDVEWDVYCTPCGGHRRTFATRKEAQGWLDEHLANDHQVVRCA